MRSVGCVSVTDGCSREEAWEAGEATVVALMGSVNVAVAQLVTTIRMLIDTEGWMGSGIQSVEHWVTWKAAVSHTRAAGLVRIARRMHELPACWALFDAGQLTEDAMVQIARRVPANRDREVAGWAPGMLISQLVRCLRSCPEDPDGEERPGSRPERQRYLRSHTRPDGWGEGMFSLPPDEMAVFEAALGAARDAEFRDRNDLPVGDVVFDSGSVDWADAFIRLAGEGLDGLDKGLARTGHRGERTKVVLHHEVHADGTLSPGQLHLGDVVPAVVARYLGCDAGIQVMTYAHGRLVGIHPAERTVNRALRRAIERRDQGCAHPLCNRRRGLHVHHLHHWADGGRTRPDNLLCLCERHHRQLHHDLFSITGNPETGTVRFHDTEGRPIEPPDWGSPAPPRAPEPNPFTPPFAERLDSRNFGWS